MFTAFDFTLSTPVSTNFSIRFSPSFGKAMPPEPPIEAASRYLSDSAPGLQKNSDKLTGYQPLSYSAWKDLIQGHSLNFIALRVTEVTNPLKLFQPRGILVWQHLLGTLQRHRERISVEHYYLAYHFGVGEACIRKILAELVHWGFIIIHRTRYSIHGKVYEMSVSFPKELSKTFKADLDKYRQSMPSQALSFSSAEPEKNFPSLEKNATTLRNLNIEEKTLTCASG